MATGNTGPPGADSTVIGPTGYTGPPGNASSVTGPQGPTGAVSTASGPTGSTGATGATSTVTGPTGRTGATGPASTVTGPMGATGGTSTVGLAKVVPLGPHLQLLDRLAEQVQPVLLRRSPDRPARRARPEPHLRSVGQQAFKETLAQMALAIRALQGPPASPGTTCTPSQTEQATSGRGIR